MKHLIHLAPEWPTKYQTFVQDDIETSKEVFQKVDIYGFRLIGNKRQIMIFWIRKMFFILKGVFYLVILAQISILFFSKQKFSYRIILQTLGLIGNFPKVLTEPLTLHSHFLAHTAKSASLLKLLNPSLRLVATAHGSEVLLTESVDLVELANVQDYIIAASFAVKDKIISDFHSTNKKPHPLISTRYCRTRETSHFSDPLNNSRTWITLLSVGRMHPQKGWKTCISIAIALRHIGVEFQWNFIGDGPQFEEIKKAIEINELDEFIKILGWKPREFCIEAMRESDFLVLPASVINGDCDGLPVVILEAMRAGAVVVSSNVGGILEAIGSGRGLLIGNDIESAARDIAVIGSDINTRNNMVIAAREWVTLSTSMNSHDSLIEIYINSSN